MNYEIKMYINGAEVVVERKFYSAYEVQKFMEGLESCEAIDKVEVSPC